MVDLFLEAIQLTLIAYCVFLLGYFVGREKKRHNKKLHLNKKIKIKR